jgi:type I restriction enzyme S subunit
MELMPGYTQTEVGVIPNEWSVEKIGELLEKHFILGHLDGNHGELYPRSHEFKAYGVPYVGANDFEQGGVTFARCKFLSDERAAKFRKGVARDGDVLFAHNATVGPVALLKTIFPFVILSTTATYFRCNPEKLNNSYIKFALQSPQFVSQYRAVMAQSTRSQVPITAQRKLSLVIAPLAEQRAIATVLNDADALLDSLDRLIAKKHDLKQAAMQQLLTGQTRLPGFSGEWEVKRLGDMGEVSGSGVDKKSHPDETPVRLVNYMDVYRLGFIESGNLDYWVTAQPHHSRRCSVERGDVFFTPSSETRQDIANSSVAMEDIADAAYSYHVVRLRFKEDWDLKYSAYAFKTRDFLNQADMICDGGGTRYVISLGKFRTMTLPAPPISEQEAIGKILFDMDLEIKRLQGQRHKTAALKQGMMQELLTGRTRLV